MVDEQVRERVLEAADRLYYGRGVQSVGMDELRLASRVSLKVLYSEFPSKAAIVLEVLDRRHALWDAGVSERVERATTPREKLLAIYDYLSDWFADDTFRGCGFINAFAELGSISPDVAQRARDHKAGFQAYVARLAAAAGADASLAPQLSILAEGAQTTAAIAGTGEAAIHARRAAGILIDAAMRS
ncbi:MAG: TetR/AcrR family transcriptional regulator [Actinomycetota bacterium]